MKLGKNTKKALAEKSVPSKNRIYHTQTLYTCGIDFKYEIGEASDLEGNQPLYSSVEELKAKRSCWESCGIMEVKLEFVKWVEPQNLFGDAK